MENPREVVDRLSQFKKSDRDVVEKGLAMAEKHEARKKKAQDRQFLKGIKHPKTIKHRLPSVGGPRSRYIE